MSSTRGQERQFRKSCRIAARHARHADSAHASVGAAARSWRGPGDPAQLGGALANRARLSLSGAASAGSARADCVRMESIRAEPAGEILPADGCRKEAARERAIQMEDARQDDCPRNADGIEERGGRMWRFWRQKRRDAELEEEIAHDLLLDAEERMQ